MPSFRTPVVLELFGQTQRVNALCDVFAMQYGIRGIGAPSPDRVHAEKPIPEFFCAGGKAQLISPLEREITRGYNAIACVAFRAAAKTPRE